MQTFKECQYLIVILSLVYFDKTNVLFPYKCQYLIVILSLS